MKLLYIVSDFFGIGISEADYGRLKGRIYQENQKNLIFLSRILCILSVPGAMSVYFIYGGPVRKFWIYVSLFFALLVSFVLAKKGGKRTDLDTNLQMYVFISVLMGYSIVLSTIINPDTMAVKYIAFIMTLPMFFTDRPMRISLYIAVCTAIFIASAVIYDCKDVLAVDIVHSLIFGTVSIVTSTYLTRMKIQRLYYEGKWKHISETDLMTGLNSRNLYEQDLAGYPERCTEKLCCVFLDVNGLHEVDINQGYDAGDRVLKTTADIFQKTFGSENTYRIGGDEFVAIIPDADESRIRELTGLVYEETTRAGFTVSIGMSFMEKDEIQMSALTKSAAREMSEVKRQHYEKAENDRRSR